MTEVTKIEGGTAVAAPGGNDAWASMIERVVMNPDADLDKLERMLAMKERMDAHGASVAFAAALAAARAEIPPITKDATVDFSSAKGRTHYKHETLAGIAKVIDPILSRHGLSYRFRTDDSQNGRVRVICIVSHAGGHSEENSLSGPPDQSGNKNSFQAAGSAVTYLQRYTLKAALGLSAEVDDDAQSAAPRPDQRQSDDPRQNRQQEQQRINQPAGPTIGDKRMADGMVAGIKQHGMKAVNDPNLQRDLATLRSRAPELAAMVDVEIEACKRKQPISGEILDDDEIPY
ncbi:ERF family protein [Gemmobacter sp. 24YEA27]|uniref:ERF family protein n=1 Tax=Gemmobacter sp. 24YEA27 TaxID=3040672 RepID=UPI0024B35D8D|nr:ERF family protein [Gemmobacter sp. 24YEA27]